MTLPEIFHLGIFFFLRRLQFCSSYMELRGTSNHNFFQPKVGQFDHKLGLHISQSLGNSRKSKLSKAPIENYFLPSQVAHSSFIFHVCREVHPIKLPGFHPASHVLWDLEVFQRLHAKPWRKGTPNEAESESHVAASWKRR